MHFARILARTSRSLFLVILGIAGASGQMSAQAQTYHVTDLGTINTDPGTEVVSSHPTGINNAGQVSGYSFSGTTNHAARFTNGLVEDLGVIPGGSRSFGVAINDLGQVVGDSEYTGSSIRHAALFSDGTATDLGFLPGWGNYSRGNGINDSGVIVGHSGPDSDTNVTRAFIWDAANGMRDIGTLGGPHAKAFSINDSGLVTGEARTGTGGDTHAFIWSSITGMQDLGTIAGNFSSGRFINANGHVVGWSLISVDNRRHAFLYDGTTMRDLGAIGNNHFFTDRSEAYGVNIHDVVVGTTYRPYQGGAAFAIAFVYRDGQMLDLETLVDASGADYRLYTATGINDAGQITVDAIKISTNQIRAVLLTPSGMPTPTPAPTTTPAATPTPSTTPAPTTTPGATPIPSTTPVPTTTPVATPTPTATPALTATPGATTPTPTPASTPTPSATSTPTPPAQTVNLSTRMQVQTGDNVGIGGFIITGSTPKRVLLRAIGPSLTQFGVPNVLADPMLELHGPGTFVPVTNNNWGEDPAQQAQIQATGLAPTSNFESAIDATLAPGAYTAIVRGTGNTSGVALVEVYDLDQAASSKLDNISTRALISSGDNIVIAGFILGGNQPQAGDGRIVVRGIGPSLTAVGVPDALANPTLELRDSNGALLVMNDDWQDDPAQAAELTAAGLAPINQFESGIVAALPPGLYTALLAGLNDGTGIGLIEVYDRGATP